jgi:hypothetical protein
MEGHMSSSDTDIHLPWLHISTLSDAEMSHLKINFFFLKTAIILAAVCNIRFHLELIILQPFELLFSSGTMVFELSFRKSNTMDIVRNTSQTL